MSDTNDFGGPVSKALEADLRAWVRKHGIAPWLDADGHYRKFVERLIVSNAERELPYEVRAFRGSYLDLMMELEGVANGTEKTPLVVHLPGLNQESVRETPLLELYAAGTRYRKGLATLVSEAAGGRVSPEQISEFQSTAELSLEAADVWLSAALASGESGFGAQLRLMTPSAILDDLLAGGSIAAEMARAGGLESLWQHLDAVTGLPGTWRDRTLPARRSTSSAKSPPSVKDVAFTAASWCLAVEYVDDLRRSPIAVAEVLSGAVGLPKAVVSTCRAVAVHLRARENPAFYEQTADATEAMLFEEVDKAKAEDLGSVDTFRFEDDTVLNAALAALGADSWDTAADWASSRIGSEAASATYWLRKDPMRQSTWQLISDAAALGKAIQQAGTTLGAKGSVDAAIDAYVDRGAAVDLAHRHLEQKRASLLRPEIPKFESIRERLDEMRRTWRAWADNWAIDFNRLCLAHGFLPESNRQQRTIFDQVVQPMTQEPGTTAYFVVDAMRFEMGAELYRQMAGESATTIQLKSRLAELPSVTEVGMNVLAPVVTGVTGAKLSPSLSDPDGGRVLGFSTGEFRVSNPETRKRAMQARVGGSSCPWLTLKEVVSRDSDSLKRSVANARLLVVHSMEIDDAGEKGAGPVVFGHAMDTLRAAWRLLRDAGVRRFVFTSDHGFLLLDETTKAAQSHGRKIDPKRRHVFSAVGADRAGEVRLALSDLAYEGVDGHLIFPETTAVFDTGRRSMSFVHGGNSLQERVIPVLTVVHRSSAGGTLLRYVLSAKPLEGVAGMHCIEVRVDLASSQDAFDFGGPKEIEVALRVLDLDDVQVELCQARGKARIVGGSVRAAVAHSFELFFRLTGPATGRAQVELHHPSQAVVVAAYVPDGRFAVAATRRPSSLPPERAEPAPTVRVSASWLDGLEGGVRQVFEHLAAHGVVTESEAATMLGGPRQVRRFSLRFEEYAKKAPFSVRIDMTAGPKRYLREGNSR